jgi:hypothetical protein
MDGPGARRRPKRRRDSRPYNKERCLFIRTVDLRGACFVFSTIHARTDLYVYAIDQVSTKHEPLQHLRSDVAVVLFLQSGRKPPRPEADHCDGALMSDVLWQLTLDCWKSTPDERPDMFAIVHRLQFLK